ncbi:dihydroorotate dehydrogenase electron transfer subunit [Anaerofilum sp. BX8]|uniref:Dihydroorotate dehydrogenase electron transfer subunit n=1 Tax=Anaerofilum hominis TaxID=2763016 RepID=A0A923IA39_9FIRM|nr:dihydroorotate dehydrogenase electron transfer subunit [Anaerofilum hominis]MBC5581068.1 dihydroorotate dehydrogenase electron transfer subunit [Anaerofilum hominis]
MQKQGLYTIQENAPLTRDVYRMVLAGDTSAVTAPGQFVNVRLDGCYLRRPISIADWDDATITLIYKVVGEGTRRMAGMGGPGAALDLLVGLGNGYDLAACGAAPVLLGGGVGVPPLYGLAKRLWRQGRPPAVLLGFNTAADVFYEQEFRDLGCPTMVATADGSYGQKGFVTDLLNTAGMRYDYFYTCGPEPMLRAVYSACACPGQLSFEERMGCGFGACMGCSCKTKYGSKRICKDGPVLAKEEVVW